MNKPDLSKPAKFKVGNKNWIFTLEERRTWWIFSWYTVIFSSPAPDEILKKVYELEGKPYKANTDEAI